MAAGDRRTPRGGSLARKYAVVLVALVGSMLLAGGGLQAYFAYRETKTSLGRIQQGEAAVAAVRIEQFLAGLLPPLSAANQVLRNLGPATPEQRQADYRRVLRQLDAVTEIRHVDASGREQVRVRRLGTDALLSGIDRPSEPHVRDALPGEPAYGPV